MLNFAWSKGLFCTFGNRENATPSQELDCRNLGAFEEEGYEFFELEGEAAPVGSYVSLHGVEVKLLRN